VTDQQEIATQQILDEALIPELSEDYFEIEGQKVQVKPLRIKYQKQWAKAFSPIVNSIAIDLANHQYQMVKGEGDKPEYRAKTFAEYTFADWTAVAGGLIEQVDVLPRLIQILCHNDGFMITDEQMDECLLQPADLQKIILKFCKKSGELERQAADFFELVLPNVRRMISEFLKMATEKAERMIQETQKSSTTTAL
jgi:hypothetical protein